MDFKVFVSDALASIKSTPGAVKAQHMDGLLNALKHHQNIDQQHPPDEELQALVDTKINSRKVAQVQAAKDEIAHLESEIKNLENELHTVRQQCLEKEKANAEKAKSVANLKKKIKFAKTCTGTTFVFLENATTGHVMTPNGLVPFHFDHSKMSQDEIRRELLKIIKTDSTEDVPSGGQI